MLEPYAIATVRNVIATIWRQRGPRERNQHRAHDPGEPERGEDRGHRLRGERRRSPGPLPRLTDSERRILLAHEVGGEATSALAEDTGEHRGRRRRPAQAHAGAAAGRVPARPRARRAADRPVPTGPARALGRRPAAPARGATPPSTCSSASLCSRLSQPLLDRGPVRDDEVQVPIAADPDIVAARQAARELAGRAGFTGTDLTLIATAVSEVARNIVRFAGPGRSSPSSCSTTRAAASGSSPATPVRASPTSTGR